MSNEIENKNVTEEVLKSAHDNLFGMYKDEDPDNHYDDCYVYCAGVRRAGLAVLGPFIEQAGGLMKFYEMYQDPNDWSFLGQHRDQPWGDHEDRAKFYNRHEAAILEYYNDQHQEYGLHFEGMKDVDTMSLHKISKYLENSDNTLAIAILMSNELYGGTTGSVSDFRWQISGNFIRRTVGEFFNEIENELEKLNEQNR